MLIGEYHHNLDEKNRLIIPSKLRNSLDNTFIITKGLEKCLFVYSMKEWDKITKKINLLPFTKKNVRAFERSFIGGASLCEFDKQGRISIASSLLDYASLSHECVIIGVNERLEIWDKVSFDEFMKVNEDNMSEIAEDLFSLGDTNA
ncbi:MAG: division/cell wall cluster transcriptional repressor MraZ [Bacilli bacterium]